MMQFEWNALRVSDRVVVHDATDPHLGLVAGTVTSVDGLPGAKDVGILIRTSEGTRVIRPRRLAVHLEPIDLDEACWRCDDLDRALASHAAR